MEGWAEEEIQNRNLRVIKRAIPKWREKVATQGDEKGSLEWAREECERYHCSSCGSPLSPKFGTNRLVAKKCIFSYEVYKRWGILMGSSSPRLQK